MLGATLQGTRCQFRVWAPQAREVLVEMDGNAEHRMALQRAADGYFSAELPDVRAGQRYFYILDGKPLPDPCSRYQPEGPHGPSQIVDREAFAWHDRDWRGITLEGQVLYELHVGTFTPEGTLAAAATRLPHLRSLGVTTVEIMPLAECPGRFNWGYDGVGWFAPYHNYGPYDALKGFVAAAHDLGIGVILDVVYNHFGPDGNYLRSYSPHYFSQHATEWGDAINYDGEHSAPVRELVVANACEWVREFHLDGLRLDATQSIFDRSEPHLLAELIEAARLAAGERRILVISENEPQKATHLLPAPEGGMGLDAMWNDDFHHSARVALTGRRDAYYCDYFGNATEFVSTAKRGFLYQGQYYPWQKQPRGEPLLRHASRCVAYLQNHDQVANSLHGLRLHQSGSPALCRALTAVLLLGPQTPLLFMGQEFHASAPFLFFADHQEPLRSQVRIGRAQFLEQFPGATSADGLKALPEPADEATFRRCVLDWNECNEDNQALRLHRDLLALRREDAVIRGQGRHGFDGAALDRRAFVLRWFHATEGDRILVVNLGGDIRERSLPEPLLAPPLKHEWTMEWSSENARYGGNGSIDPHPNKGWHIPGQSAMLLRAARAGHQ